MGVGCVRQLWYEGLSWKHLFPWSQTAAVLCNKVHKRREKMSGGVEVDATRNFTMSKMIMQFVCGCVIKVHSFCWFCWKTFLKWKQRVQNVVKHTWICPIETLICNCWTNDYTLVQLDAGKNVQYGIECVTVCHLDYSKWFRPVHQPVHLR